MATREDFPSSNIASKPQQKSIQPVKGKVSIKEPSLLSDFLASDVKTVSHNLLKDVLIPAARDTVSKMFNGFIDGLLYGSDARTSSSRGSNDSRVYKTYERYVDPDIRHNGPNRQGTPRPTRNFKSLSEIYFEDGSEARRVLNNMVTALEENNGEPFTVKDLYISLGMRDKADYTMDNWGWYNLDNARVTQTINGWLLKLPQPIVLN